MGQVTGLPSDNLKQGWLRGGWAEDRDGRPVDPSDPSATQFCMVGAIDASLGRGQITEEQHDRLILIAAQLLLAEEREHLPFREDLQSGHASLDVSRSCLMEFNDGTIRNRRKAIGFLQMAEFLAGIIPQANPSPMNSHSQDGAT